MSSSRPQLPSLITPSLPTPPPQLPAMPPPPARTPLPLPPPPPFQNQIESYNPQRNEWTPRPSLSHQKGCLSGVTLCDKFFAIGGGDGLNCFSDVQMFDPAVGRWIPTQSMHQKRFSSAAAELNGAIYAAGGFHGENYLNSVNDLIREN
ncbi:hypothetical protein MKW98_019633 [Papaver atlanticum]|uniref:Uncharacterized protein n=1 Tax=Papaver atlanticum TaxID=357466 RepID=A0AAD4X9R1_9MAGN|nr:hypothetical protein MKW98_019633 [Papaver atlanticum]